MDDEEPKESQVQLIVQWLKMMKSQAYEETHLAINEEGSVLAEYLVHYIRCRNRQEAFEQFRSWARGEDTSLNVDQFHIAWFVSG